MPGGTAIFGVIKGRASGIGGWMEARSGSCRLGIGDLEVRPIRDEVELDAVHRLTHDSYVAEGFIEPTKDGRLIHFPQFDGLPETTVLVAVVGLRIVGTLSMTRDGRKGLPPDRDFARECDEIRASGRRIGAFWRIVTHDSCRKDPLVSLSLLRGGAVRFLRDQLNTCLCVMNPRHEGAYRKLFNMREVARRDGTDGLRNAPGVLLRGDSELKASSSTPWGMTEAGHGNFRRDSFAS